MIVNPISFNVLRKTYVTLIMKGGVKHMEKLIYLAEKAGKAAIKMGKQSVQKSPICGLFEPRIPKQLKK